MNKAEEYARQFYIDIGAVRDIYPEDSQQLDELAISFTEFYEKGKWMAHQYIEGGPARGNPAMAEFDTYGVEINNQLDQVVTKFSTEGDDFLQTAIDNNALSRTLSLVFQ